MSQTVTLDLPETLIHRAKTIATQTHKSVEEVLLDWLDFAASDPPLASLPDDEILALCHSEMPPEQQQQLSQLLAQNREATLEQAQQNQLDQLMKLYRRGLVRKAQAWQIAVERGLKETLD